MIDMEGQTVTYRRTNDFEEVYHVGVFVCFKFDPLTGIPCAFIINGASGKIDVEPVSAITFRNLRRS